MNQFVTEWNTWRDSRNSALAKPFGWLSVVGLHWLDAESTWTDAPGTFTVDDGWVTVSLKTGIKAGPAAETFDLLSKVDNAGPVGLPAAPVRTAEDRPVRPARPCPATHRPCLG